LFVAESRGGGERGKGKEGGGKVEGGKRTEKVGIVEKK